jgi:glycosyltransferase involved in cell wall biosynthesis
VTNSTERVDTIGIVVPACNEELRLPRSLAALTAAARQLVEVDGVPRVRLIVVVDRSTDGTLGIAQGWPGVEVVVSNAGRVGAARASGIAKLLTSEARRGIPARHVWIACTDADSAVPTDWLVEQLRHARAGVELLLGTVRPDPDELAAGLLAAWRLRHQIADGHPYVHGANLGIRGDTYRAAGGFADVPAHEDALLSDAVRRSGAVVLSTGSAAVLTSGRITGRTPDGLAHYLRELSELELSLEA